MSAASQMAPYSLHTALILIISLWALVKSSALQYIGNRVPFGIHSEKLCTYLLPFMGPSLLHVSSGTIGPNRGNYIRLAWNLVSAVKEIERYSSEITDMHHSDVCEFPWLRIENGLAFKWITQNN